MKRTVSPPVILSFPTADLRFRAASPGDPRSRLERISRLRCVSNAANDEVSDAPLTQMRTRLLQMILENERVRNDGPRAS